MKVATGMLQKLFSFTSALIHDWKMYGNKKENSNIEIKLTHVEKLQFSLFLISCCPEILNSSWLSWYLVLKIACLHVSFTAYENFYKLSKLYCLLVWFSTFQPSEVVRKQISNNQTDIHLYTDLMIHKYICDRSLSGYPFHIVHPFLNAKGLFKCDSTHIPN